MVNKSALKNQFCELTGTSTTTAGRYLEASKYNIDQAVDSYFTKHASKSSPNSKSNGKSASSNTDKHLVSLFDEYKDANNPNVIDIDGTLKYLDDLQIDPDDVKALTLAFLLKSPSVGVFERDKFISIWQHYKIHDIKSMRKFLDKFHQDVLYDKGSYTDLDTDKAVDFKQLYDYTFAFLKESDNQKVLDIDLTISYWKLLLPLITTVYFTKNETPANGNKDKVEERVNNWFDFLSNSNPRPVITFDTWSMFYLFFLEVVLPDPYKLSNYDEMAAWPSKVDEYVEYLSDNSLI
ncbi:DCN1 [Candida theae]|uniref:Defective in cullin neddylation protein n=1 Tax=Candida theae TaxID=1198502 RepID=A0AAD5BJK9_9ASCO|nr:DCN1 [Candida theae]KAI5968887.1 DCN1 [Candida theae]